MAERGVSHPGESPWPVRLDVLLLTLGVVCAATIGFAPLVVAEYGVTLPMILMVGGAVAGVTVGHTTTADFGRLSRLVISPLGLWVVAGALLLPLIFDGVLVFRSATGTGRLELGTDNLFHLLQLAVFVCVTAYLAELVATSSQAKRWIAIAFLASGWLCAVLAALQLAMSLGVVAFVEGIYNNPSFVQLPNQLVGGSVPRLTGLLIEPSFAASYLAAYTAFAAHLYIRRTTVVPQAMAASSAVLGLAMLILTASTTAAIGIVALAVSVFRRRGSNGGVDRRRMWRLVLVSISAAGIVVSLGLRQVDGSFTTVIAEVIADKSDSLSAQARADGESEAFSSLRQTYGLGVGWGSGDGFSLASTLMVGLGIPGVLQVGAAARRARLRLPQDPLSRSARTALLVGLATALISVPQYVLYHYWILGALGLHSTSSLPTKGAVPVGTAAPGGGER